MSWLRLLLAGLVALAAGSGLRAADGQKGIVDELLDTFRKNILKETTPEQSAEPTEESTAYIQDLENQLAVKNGLLDEALRLHRIFHGRLVTLSEGLERKDHQLARESQSKQDAWRQAAKQTEDCQHWRQMAESLEETEGLRETGHFLHFANNWRSEDNRTPPGIALPGSWKPIPTVFSGLCTEQEENSALRDELVESRENYQRLQHFVEGFELQSAARTVGPRSRTISTSDGRRARWRRAPTRRTAARRLSASRSGDDDERL
eukprot:g11710.t1